MNSQVKLVSCTSLEDKAKEWFEKIVLETPDKKEWDSCYVPVKACDVPAYISGYQQALKDMMGRAKETSVTAQCLVGYEDVGACVVVPLGKINQIAEDLKV